jgi:thioredoxin-related protein
VYSGWNRSFSSGLAGIHKILAVLFLSTMAVAGPVASDSTSMIQVQDLREEARLAKSEGLILVLEISSASCPYCRKIEKLFLLPMQRNAEYDDKILIRSVSLDEFETLVDFEGESISGAEFAARYQASLTPTLLFLNAEGVEMTEKLVGIWSEDFYGGFIDDRIEQARSRLAQVELAKSGISPALVFRRLDAIVGRFGVGEHRCRNTAYPAGTPARGCV